jgi:hypothetical protein
VRRCRVSARRPLCSLLLVVAACTEPNLGEVPFLCNKGNPRCPEGYVCIANRCVRDGDPPPVDARPRQERTVSLEDEPFADSVPLPDQRLPTPDRLPPAPDKPKLPPDQPQPPPQVEVSEFMANPSLVDSDREWFELHNLGSQPVDINGWILADKDIDLHVISAGGPLIIPAKGYLVLGRSTDKLKNGNAPVQYGYGQAYTLANTEDEIILKNTAGVVVDSVSYSTSAVPAWTIPDGGSLSLKKNAVGDHNSATNWCAEPASWATGTDKGTPGAPPGC